jgi:hypothetical protein
MELNLKLETSQNSLEPHRLPLPLELNCQIFECLKVPIQKKFICGLGKGIYGMFRLKVLTKVELKYYISYSQMHFNRAKDSAILNKMAGTTPTQMP